MNYFQTQRRISPMGSLFKPKQPSAPPPAPPVLVRDEVNGVEQVPVIAADGTTTYITRAIPLTAQQQAERDEINKIVSESLAEITKLSRTDYAADEATQKVLNEWQTRQEQLLAHEATRRQQQEEERLAQRGLGDSTAAASLRRQRALDEQEARSTLSLTRSELGNQIRGEKLALQQNLFNTASGVQNAAQARTARAATAGLSDAVALNVQRQSSILDYYNAQNRQQSNLLSAFGSMGGGSFGGSGNQSGSKHKTGEQVGGVLGGAIGGSVGGPAGAALGSSLGSWLGRSL
jgi:hypothetical protein